MTKVLLLTVGLELAHGGELHLLRGRGLKDGSSPRGYHEAGPFEGGHQAGVTPSPSPTARCASEGRRGVVTVTNKVKGQLQHP